ncbi:hypothetical protein JHN59_40495, partial [Streptomyces sp. MBT49]|uniref:hypothetical protein n=1 Tax=Streptomyces sp. MBT49 TaxID=1488380 RepID=UPI001A354237|nr:hypothetical protein [Streptomyces sp. MBT49]
VHRPHPLPLTLVDGVHESGRQRVRAVHAVLWQGEFASVIEALGEPDRARLAEQLIQLTREFDASNGTARGAVGGNAFHGPTAVQTGDHNQQENHFGSGG